MRKPFAINSTINYVTIDYVTHDCVMQSPGAFQ
jgi:hypothetical protein